MSTHVRHFVSQRFGKSLVRLDLGNDSSGTVAIEVPGSEQKTVAFQFDRLRLEQMFRDAAALPEIIMRMAIAQAHKLFALHGEQALFGATLPLSEATAPWLGDLSDARYGGATAGYDSADGASAPCPVRL